MLRVSKLVHVPAVPPAAAGAHVVAEAAAAERKAAKTASRQARKDIKHAQHTLSKAREREILDRKMASDIALRDDPLAIVIDDPNDARLSKYRDLKNAALSDRDGYFIIEGPEPLKLLLAAQDVLVDSLLCKPTIYARLRDGIAERAKNHGGATPLSAFVATHQIMSKVVGYPVNRGALACAIRPVNRDEAWLREHVLRDDRKFWRVLAIDGCNNTANLGSLMRTATAFGMDAVILSDECCDPWYRQAVRVSMGHVFRTPVVRVPSLAETLSRLFVEAGMRSYGAVIDENKGTPKMESLEETPPRWCGVVGNEDKGVSPQVRGAIQTPCRIDMQPGVDSLSITVAAGVFLNGLREREQGDRGW